MPAYKRILLKLSGEALMGDDAYGINRATMEGMVREVRDIVELGVEVAVVIGENGGSYARYLDGKAALGATEQTFTYTFTAPVTNIGAQFQILGAVGAAASRSNRPLPRA